MSEAIAPITREIVLRLDTKTAFELFVHRFNEWWPAEYTWSKDVLESISIEPQQGGRCTEVGPNNFQLDWGQVLTFEPPQRLVLLWQITPESVPQPNPDKASRIEIVFHAIDDQSTLLSLQHRELHRHGARAREYRDALNSDMGWAYILNKLLIVSRAQQN